MSILVPISIVDTALVVQGARSVATVRILVPTRMLQWARWARTDWCDEPY
jgi:hypothetical protein